jgi:two-component system, OmpR family, KDP operon response regulator KdpE
MAHILLVDDEAALTAVLRPTLTAAGYDVTTAASGAEAIRQADLLLPDVILLDLGLPDRDGKAVIHTLRIKHDMPIIVISARHQEGEKIAALDEGADDYVDKPFEIGELMARIRVVLRRKPGAETATRYRSGPLAIDFETRSVTLEGDQLKLSPKEYDLLLALARNAGRVVTHKRLLAAGWGSDSADTQYLRVYMGLLRQKIEEDPSDPKLLLTEPGVGYRIAPSEA